MRPTRPAPHVRGGHCKVMLFALQGEGGNRRVPTGGAGRQGRPEGAALTATRGLHVRGDCTADHQNIGRAYRGPGDPRGAGLGVETGVETGVEEPTREEERSCRARAYAQRRQGLREAARARRRVVTTRGTANAATASSALCMKRHPGIGLSALQKSRLYGVAQNRRRRRDLPTPLHAKSARPPRQRHRYRLFRSRIVAAASAAAFAAASVAVATAATAAAAAAGTAHRPSRRATRPRSPYAERTPGHELVSPGGEGLSHANEATEHPARLTLRGDQENPESTVTGRGPPAQPPKKSVRFDAGPRMFPSI